MYPDQSASAQQVLDQSHCKSLLIEAVHRCVGKKSTGVTINWLRVRGSSLSFKLSTPFPHRKKCWDPHAAWNLYIVFAVLKINNCIIKYAGGTSNATFIRWQHVYWQLSYWKEQSTQGKLAAIATSNWPQLTSTGYWSHVLFYLQWHAPIQCY